MKPLSKVKIDWSPGFAYVIGLITTDGNLSPDGRHINYTSKDLELVSLVKSILNLSNKIGRKSRSANEEKKYYVLQFGDVNFYKFLLNIGLTPCKSKTLGEIKIPDQYFYDFLRGCLDGDGTIGTNFHPESRYLQLKVRFASASINFLQWIQQITLNDGIKGFFTQNRSVYSLGFAKEDSKKIFKLLYYKGCEIYLTRKYLKAKPYLD